MEKNIAIDWNTWYSPLKESLQAFDIDAAAFVAEKFGLHWHASEEDPVTVSSINIILTEICEDLILKHETGWQYVAGEPLEHNTYIDDAGILTEEVCLYTHDDILLQPKFIVKLRNSSGFYFEIDLVIADQTF